MGSGPHCTKSLSNAYKTGSTSTGEAVLDRDTCPGLINRLVSLPLALLHSNRHPRATSPCYDFGSPPPPPSIFKYLFSPLFLHRCLKSTLIPVCDTQLQVPKKGVSNRPEAPHAFFIFLRNRAPLHMTEEILCKQLSYPPNAYLMEVFAEKHYKNFQIETISIHSNLHLLSPISKAACSALILTPACSSKPCGGEFATQLPLETTGAIQFSGEKIIRRCLKLGGTTLCF